ncbi:MAG TPA: FkbM family methyltransferase [Dongiaceae bacterium]|nr:FkbM family methyltransferase [Dongiaceae bacterium]
MQDSTSSPVPGRAGLRERLWWRAVTSKRVLRFLATRVLNTDDPKIRARIFKLLGEAPGRDYAFADLGRERYLVPCRDQAIGRSVFVTGEYEFDKFERALQLLRRHSALGEVDLLIDVGANIGTVSIPAVARGLVPAAVAIEPHPGNCLLLRANLALNRVDGRVTVHECAVGGADEETLALELSHDNQGDHRIAVSRDDGAFGESARRTIPIRSTRLDRLVAPQPGKRLLIWMDTQGYEGVVLQGASALLAARVPIVSEFWPYGMRRAGGFALFRDRLAGYRGFVDLQRILTAGDVTGDRGALRPLRELDDLHAALDVDPQAYTDLLIV